MTTPAGFRRFVVLAIALTVAPLFACAQSDPAARTPRRQRPAPSWVMPPIEALRTQHRTFVSTAAGTDVSYLIHLPSSYEKNADQRFPVVYWLHGIGGSQAGVPRFVARLDEAIEAGKAPPMIFVFVNGMVDSLYCDSADGKTPIETVIVKDLIPHIDATHRTVAQREGRMIEGFSMGGLGAARLGFKFPELFGAVSMIDGAMLDLATLKRRHADLFARIFAENEERVAAEMPWSLLEKNAAAIRGRTTVRQIVGALAGPNESFHRFLERFEIAHEYEVFREAGHNHAAIYDLLADKNWAFYRRAFSATIAAAP